jgi:peptidoglycan hydrolase-like protein with peptidoglycan-binding domain
MSISDLPDWLPREIILPGTDQDKEAVRLVQRVLRAEPTGLMDGNTLSSIRGFQRLHRLPVTGMLDKATAWAIEKYRWC